MTNDTSEATAIESERQLLLQQFRADASQSSSAGYGPGSFGCHELLDRTALIARLLHELVLEHPACIQQRGWFALAYEASSILSRLYQEIGCEHLEPNAA